MKKLYLILKILLVLYLVLLIPLPENKQDIKIGSEKPFVWNKDELWNELEQSFKHAKELPASILDSAITHIKNDLDRLVIELEEGTHQPEDSILTSIETEFFRITPLIAAKSENPDWYIGVYNRVRKKLKTDSRSWDMNRSISRNRMYRLLYGMRAATEEVLLQLPAEVFESTMFVSEEKSITPSTMVLGIRVHSGDLLVSRGGAEVSAFISRGNDYPGNFSHVAMIHIDKVSDEPYFVEAHIERGVAIASLEEYVKDKKLRFMVMRPRADLPEMIENPMLPYEASSFIYAETKERHIPYDFKMDYYDDSAMFCSEVGSNAYKRYGIDLWEFNSTISSPGIINWLNAFGVQHFVTQMPSDLEYDPNFSVVAEWRDRSVLFQDHVDNAVMDALITRANEGENLDYNIWALPLARLLKGYSSVLNLVGKEGIIPEGMSSVMALKNNDFVERFQNCKTITSGKIDSFIEANGYLPPYWQLVKMAESSLDK